jgi:exopolyphosphatase/guanosine-5'-triphosphate,3'-diphosphate pyrophosphatase
MRLGVLDVGSNTVHLVVFAGGPGRPPTVLHAEKTTLRLAERLGPAGELAGEPAEALIRAVAAARRVAARVGVDELIAVATSVIREAPDAAEVLARVATETGIRPRVLSGAEEAGLTFLAARRWLGWSAGRLLLLDIGGGSLETAVGAGEAPDDAVSLPLGAGRMARRLIDADPADPPSNAALRGLRAYLEEQLDLLTARLGTVEWDTAVATSRTFRILTRLAGAEGARRGTAIGSELSRPGLNRLVRFIRHIPAERLAQLPGVPAARAPQLLAGAVVAETVMRRLGVETLVLSPWALREGVALQRFDIASPAARASRG